MFQPRKCPLKGPEPIRLAVVGVAHRSNTVLHRDRSRGGGPNAEERVCSGRASTFKTPPKPFRRKKNEIKMIFSGGGPSIRHFLAIVKRRSWCMTLKAPATVRGERRYANLHRDASSRVVVELSVLYGQGLPTCQCASASSSSSPLRQPVPSRCVDRFPADVNCAGSTGQTQLEIGQRRRDRSYHPG